MTRRPACHSHTHPGTPGWQRVAWAFAAVLLLLLPGRAFAQLAQTIVFTQPPPREAFAGTSVVLAATASSGLPVSFAVVSGPGEVSGLNGSTLAFTGVGTVVVQATQAGGNGFAPANPVAAPPVNVQLLTQAVTSRSAPVSTVVTFTGDGVLANVAALTQGALNLDFKLATGTASTACRPGAAYTAGQTCTLSFVFEPTRPGIRYGGLTLTDPAGVLLGNGYIYGYGVGPQVLYAPIVQTLVGNSLGEPSGVAINGKGDLFVSNYIGTGLSEIASNGTVRPIGNFGPGKDVAVDGSGNVFLITYDTLYEVVAVNGSLPTSPTIRTLATGLSVDGGGLAIDGSGNAYIANGPGGSTRANPMGVVYRVAAVAGVIPDRSPKQVIGPTFAEPTGVAVDSAGNVYLSDGYAPGIFEMLAVNGRVPASPTVVSLGSGYVSPSNIRLDNTNDIFISDAGLPGVLEYPATNGVVSPSAKPRSLGSGFVMPEGLLVDNNGDLFVADRGFPQVVKLNYSVVPTLTFAPTLVGQRSADSPQTVTYTNAGNADLVFTPPASGTNPAITSDFALDATSTCPQLRPGSGTPATLPVGQTCTDQVSFTPTAAGPRTGTLTTVDNDLSVANATQVVHLNGTGTLQAPSLAFAIPSHFVDDPPFAVAATSNSPGAIRYSVLSGPAALAGSVVTLAGQPGNVAIQATQDAIGSYAAATQVATFAVARHAQTIAFAQPASPTRFGSAPLTLTASASSGLPVTFSVLSGPATLAGSTVTFTAPGAVVLAADQPGNATFDPATQVTRTVVVTSVRIALAATPSAALLRSPVTLVATLLPMGGTPTGSVTFADGSVSLATVPLAGLSATFTTSALALGSHTLTATYMGDSAFNAVTSPPQTVTVGDFSLTLANPDVTIPHGGTATYALLLSSIGNAGAASLVDFQVTGLPAEFQVAFTPQRVPVGSGATPVTLTVSTPNYPVVALAGYPRLTLAGLALGLMLMRRRRALHGAGWSPRLFSVLAPALLLLGSLGLAACGSGWRTQHFQFTVSATSGSLARTVSASLVSDCKDHSAACPVQ